jgi:hypothetical protein
MSTSMFRIAASRFTRTECNGACFDLIPFVWSVP